ncbi:MAG: hypothetical protein HY350_03500 [Candidatus Omnitrophica bacterium]|nr:hypothetical protein [Candidatus Omnitrophota bacterium]
MENLFFDKSKNIGSLLGCEKIYTTSATEVNDTLLFLAKKDGQRHLIVWTQDIANKKILAEFSGSENKIPSGIIKICPLSSENAAVLRNICPFTIPVPVGNKTAFGFGDRLGNATAGHARVAKRFKIIPIFAQQSVREMTRTGRTPQEVMDDALWGVFQEHYTEPFGADADHLKTIEDIEGTAKAGFTMFTIDPSDKIRGTESFIPALEHILSMYNHLKKLKNGKPFDFEVSIDETDLYTSPQDHLFIATWLKENGVKVTSIAPRFTGEFQKGIDYIGDINEFTRQIEEHAIIANKCGGYKISIHSGSDKFSIFPVIGKITKGVFHEKTAGTSYLEAIKTISQKAPVFYREIHKFALTRFEEDRASYHVTTNLSAIPDIDRLSDDALPQLFSDNNTRQLIHITYGSILQSKDKNGRYIFRDELMQLLDKYEEEYYKNLECHFTKHLEAFNLPKS